MTYAELWMNLSVRGFDIPVGLCWVLAEFIADGDTTYISANGGAHGDEAREPEADWIPLCGQRFGAALVSPDVEVLLRRYVASALQTEALHSDFRAHIDTPAVRAWTEKTS